MKQQIIHSFFTFLLFTLSLSNTLKAQSQMVFESIFHDFGKIKEEAGKVSHTFTFTNTGSQPLEIFRVEAACGCTSTEWSKGVIQPQQKGFITASYDPANRPGVFSKTVTIYNNTPQNSVVLMLEGEVLPRPKTIADTLVVKLGALRLKTQAFDLGEITTEKAIRKSYEIYNDSTAYLELMSEAMNLPAHIKVEFEPKRLAPKQKGWLHLTYDPLVKAELGYVFDIINVFTNEPANQRMKQLYVISTIKEHFPTLTEEQLQNAPRIHFENTVYDFGNVKVNEQVSYDFIFTNKGKTDLNLRQAKASCGCTATNPDKKVLLPNQSSKITVTYTGVGEGMQQKTISVFSNDPTQPTIVLTIKMNVIK
ncbi:MAG: DUF1573 domain-containing protein [Cytophagales bacterium]|nr:MAG: DUF1573 domain-containing protein [Cytophagales bacterium]